jgi:hypothetical protein
MLGASGSSACVDPQWSCARVCAETDRGWPIFGEHDRHIGAASEAVAMIPTSATTAIIGLKMFVMTRSMGSPANGC